MNRIPLTTHQKNVAEVNCSRRAQSVGKVNISNKKSGSDFEHEFCKIASEAGFWAHKIQDAKNGQPADVIMCRNNIAALVDCKVCENDIFKLSRIEENQELAMEMWAKRGNEFTAFALKLNSIEEVRMISYFFLKGLKSTGFKQLNKEQILEYSKSFDQWQEELP
jgi:Holliday junction resolvase